ncbi:uncharacterized protein [Amphiura filiformis]|uniref:uncharacterized protein n=1 Tax=Amphiura filiformis TaxID=82378 RepID=UPI003B20BE0B
MMLLQLESALFMCTLCFVLVQNSETTEETQLQLTIPVEPVEDGMLSLHCQIWNLDPEYTVIMARTIRSVRETLSFNRLVPDDQDRMFLAVRQMPDSSVVYFLTIIQVTSEDTGNYSCKVITTSGKTADIATDSEEVIVSYFPHENSLDCAPNAGPMTLIAGKETTFNCSSQVTGHPLVSLEWNQVGSFTTLESDSTVTDSQIHSQLSFTPSIKDDGAILLCIMTSPAFLDKTQSCHVGPLKVIPSSEDTEIIVTQISGDVTVRTTKDSYDNDVVKPIAQRCGHLCEASTRSKLFYWILATSVTGALALIFLLFVLVLFLKLVTRNKPSKAIRKLPMEGLYPEDIYVDLERRRGGEKVYMALEKRDNIEDI